MALNRQQRRQKERESRKEVKKHAELLSKLAITSVDKKKAAMGKWVASLNQEQAEYVSMIIDSCTKSDINVFAEAYSRVLDVYLTENGLPIEDLDKIYSLLEEEGKLTKKYIEKGESYVMKIDKLKPEIIEKYEELKNNGMKDKKIINELIVKFNQISTTSVRKIINEHKRNTLTDKDMNEAMNNIEQIISEPVKKKEPEPQAKKEDLIIFEESNKKITLDAKGSMGTYHIEDGTATIEEFTFVNYKDVDEEIALRRRVLEKELNRLELREKEYKAIVDRYLK